MEQKIVLAIGRWMPIHLGHKYFLTNLAREYDTLIVGIGSCYENGTPRNCIPALEREKLLRTIFKNEGIDNYIIVHVPDRPTFELWFSDIVNLCNRYHVTHFCTGNKEDILNVMEEKGLQLSLELINPEDTSNFPYHATDIRNAILNNEPERLDQMIPKEIKEAVLSQIATEIKMATEGKGQEFIPGRQTVDIVFLVNDPAKQQKYLLLGKRNEHKIDFPGFYAIPGGGIQDFESPIHACIRCFEAETGIQLQVTDHCTEPTSVAVCNLQGQLGQLYFTGIYASHDSSINGTLGGGSQCFALIIDGSIDDIMPKLYSSHDMVELKFVAVDDVYTYTLAYDQKRMVYHALTCLQIPYDKGEMLQHFHENGTPANHGISRSVAHKEGILHGASHIHIYKKEDGILYLLLQRRSYNKDSFPGCLDVSSAGHIEFGSDFLQTAQKELFEELGIKADILQLEELFDQRIHHTNKFYGHEYIDYEINKIYALEMSCNLSDLCLQSEEVCDAVWMTAEEILRRVKNNDTELCANKEELTKVIQILLSK